MTPSEILVQWEEHHQELTASLRATFLARSEVADLAELPRSAVELALLESPKLTKILREARQIAREKDDEAARAIETLKRHRSDAVGPKRMGQPPVTTAKIKFGCGACGREFVDDLLPGIACRRCRTDANVQPVCPRCGRTGDLASRGWCRRCSEAAQVASEAAGPGSQGPEGVDSKDPDRRKRRWNAQQLDRPD